MTYDEELDRYFDDGEYTKRYTCKKCKRNDLFDYEFPKRAGKYATNGICKNCRLQNKKNKRRKFKLMCLNYKGGKCVSCGYRKCLDALEFHHLDPKEKDFNISSVTVFKFLKVKDELDKCVVLCSNCHREVHAGYPLTINNEENNESK